MDVSHHGSHLVQLTRLRLSNCYLVREDDGLTLVDTTLPGAADAILAAAERLGAPIRRILLTHAHNDHYGSLDALRARLPDAEVLIGARDAKLLAGDRSREPGEPDGLLFPPFFMPAAKTRPTRTLTAGDRVGSLEVHDAPGHTPGQIALLDTRDRTLICGDAYLTVGSVYVTTQPKLPFPLPALVGTWHKPTAWESARRLRELDPACLATGHGPVVEDPGVQMTRALAAAPRA